MIGIAVLALFLITLNLLFWLIFLNRFKKLFSTADIINQARLEMKAMIDDVNRITSRNIDIIEEKIRKLKSASAEAERKITLAQTELEKKASLSEYRNILESPPSVNQSYDTSGYSISSADNSGHGASIPPKKAFEAYDRLSDGLNSNKSYSITTEGKKMLDGEQGDLFEENQETTYINSPSGTKFTVDNEGTSVASIPKLGPNVTFSDNPVVPKKSLNDSIRELNNKGYTVEMIARELNLTTTEVQFSLDMWQ
jgi:hypothetical protein